jgi:hypothetical protein
MTQTSHAKGHKLPTLRQHKMPASIAQSSHLPDANRTSSLFSLVLGLREESLVTSPLRCRAASHGWSSKSMEGGSPFQTIPQKQTSRMQRSNAGLEETLANERSQQ